MRTAADVLKKLNRTGTVAAALAAFAAGNAGAETPGSSVAVSGQNFAIDGPSSRVDLNAHLKSDETLYNGLVPARELRFLSFFETGATGDRSFDLDSSAVRKGLGESAHLWFGKVHPLNEGFAHSEVLSTGAIGANWVQNQSNALEPRVSGWIGAGAHFKQKDSGLFASVMASPFYLPSFGPGITFSETNSPTGSRFARLPPLYITIKEQQLPLRYRIDTGDLMKIVLQPQAFFAVGQESSTHRLSFMAWSAPGPNPKVSASGKLKVDAENAAVLVTAVPSFPRENFAGIQWSLFSAPLKPSLETVYEASTGRLAVSARVEPVRFVSAGYLTTFEKEAPPSDGSPSVSSPSYARHLAWLEAAGAYSATGLRPSVRLERHFGAGLAGQWLRPAMDYRMDARTSLFASASIITGADFSYFGTWKSLDSVSVGGRYQW